MRRAPFALAAAAVLASAAIGCKTEKESLIIAGLQASDANGGQMTTVTLSVAAMPAGNVVASHIFDLPTTGLPMTTPIKFGIYVPAGEVGQMSVFATARPTTGCVGYSGSKPAKVSGGDSPTILVTLRPDNDVCMVTGTGGMGGTTGGGGTTGTGGGGTTGTGGGGTTGSAGTTGAGGSGGNTPSGCGTAVGTPPTPAAPPSLNNCVEVDHYNGVPCDAVNDINNPLIFDVAVSPDGTLMASAGNEFVTDAGTVRIWRMQGNTAVQCGPSYSGVGNPYVAFSPNGQYMAIAWRFGYVDVYNVPSFTFVTQIRSAPGELYGVGFSPDSQTVFTLDYDSALSDGNLYADRLNGSAITSRMVGLDPDVLAVSPLAGAGGLTTIAVGGYVGNAAVYTFNGSTISAPTFLPTAGSAAAWAIGFSPDGQLLGVGTNDGTVRFWAAPFTSTAQSGSPIVAGSPTSIITGLSFSRNGTHLALAFDSEVAVWNAMTRTAVSRHSLPPVAGATSQYADSVTFSASGSQVIVGEDYCGKVMICTN